MKAEFLQWKELLPFIKKETEKAYPPFRSPFLYVSTPKLNNFSKYIGKFVLTLKKIIPFLRWKLFNIELYKILGFMFFLGIVVFFGINAIVAHKMGMGGGVVLAIPGITIPFPAVIGMLLAVFFHELGHAGVMLEKGYPPKDIGMIFLLLIPIGAAVRMREEFEEEVKKDPEAKIAIYSAGVVMNFVLCILAIPAAVLVGRFTMSNWWTEAMIWTFIINFGVGMVNMLTIPPMDGYFILDTITQNTPMKLIEKRVMVGSFIAISIFVLLLNFGLIALFL